MWVYSVAYVVVVVVVVYSPNPKFNQETHTKIKTQKGSAQSKDHRQSYMSTDWPN
jgi:hypothetical protein